MSKGTMNDTRIDTTVIGAKRDGDGDTVDDMSIPESPAQRDARNEALLGKARLAMAKEMANLALERHQEAARQHLVTELMNMQLPRLDSRIALAAVYDDEDTLRILLEELEERYQMACRALDKAEGKGQTGTGR
jgi:hypothetical protein